ncbi:L-threonylcarbamoyladenylate synthase [Aurantimonas sp. Leaf443]|uniref:L-threonylcarbamoyladenylate synthase n=1 Tax=Aurantimonas sp. Leaf443 TaxID=1736378 RepID=UPI0006F7EF1B|nr:L-threonylcarbamoyladenylate synthase [Aurantimonas sp. Leaf443]KQT88533.1 translation factor Sua5 [Aurantimonas sp. Leaf443]
MTKVRPADDPHAEAEALDLLRAGQLVAIPTETVYGLAGDASSGEAVARIFEAKGRPRFNPLICHVADLAMAEELSPLGPLARRLAQAFWPGPLTIVVPRREGAPVHPLATAGLATVALRCPQGVGARLASALGRPLAAPSANPSGRVSPTTAAHVASGLAGRLALVLDGGPCGVGVESTIVAPRGDEALVLLRAGGISRAELSAATGVPVLDRAAGAAVTAPGQLASHYAPQGHVRLEATSVRAGEAYIGFGPGEVPGLDGACAALSLSPSGDLREAAANLFAALKAFDDPAIAAIAVAPIPHEGLGEAINDRLRRAAAPR